MAKDKSAKQPKFASVEEAKENLGTTREELQVAKDELKAYRSEHKLKKDEDYSGDKKHGKKLASLESTITAKQAAITSIKEWIAENKPAKEKKTRVTSYEYPEGMDAAARKKFRAEQRRLKKKAEKEAAAGTEGGEKKKAKAPKTEEAETEAPKKKKKSKPSED